MKTYVIAEAGVNHNGSLEMALSLVDAAAQAGADVVKFQTFKAEKVVSRVAKKAEYQQMTTDPGESQVEMIRKLELSEADFRKIRDHCLSRGIRFLSTPFDEESLEFLVGNLDMPEIKIPSGEITNPLLLLQAARTGRPVLLSTGMSFLGEVETALGVLAFGYLQAEARTATSPLPGAFEEAFRSEAGQELLRRKVRLFHCTTEYPAPVAEVNLRAMATMRQAFGLEVGLSDHTQGIIIPCAAVALGATMIEKHFTLDRNLPGPDHKASLEPGELRAMIDGIRAVELAMGTGNKLPAPSEWKNRAIARKSLVAARDLAPGERLDAAAMTLKRPGTGISPMRWWEMLGETVSRAYSIDEVLEK